MFLLGGSSRVRPSGRQKYRQPDRYAVGGLRHARPRPVRALLLQSYYSQKCTIQSFFFTNNFLSSFTIFNSCLVAFNCSQLFETRSNDQRSCPQNHCWRKGTTDVYLTILKVIEPFYFISQLGLITEHDFKSKTIIGLKFIPLLCPIGYCLISRKIFSIPLEI